MKKQVIKFNGEAVGAVMPDGTRFRFIAVKYNVWSLDGRVFSHPMEAKHAVMALLAKPAGRSMPAASFWVPGDGDPLQSQFGWNAVSVVPDRHSDTRPT